MAAHDEDLLDEDETTPFAANAENKQLDKDVIAPVAHHSWQ